MEDSRIVDEPGSTSRSASPPTHEANIVVLYSPVEGIPPTHCHLLRDSAGSAGESSSFRVVSALDVKELSLGERRVEFNPPITLQPGLYALNSELQPIPLTAGKAAS